MIDRLRRRLESEAITEGRAEVMDGQALDLPDDGFDVAVSVLGLIFFPDRAKGLSEMRRILKPGGRAAVVSWSTPDRVPVVSDWGKAARGAIPDLPVIEDPPIFSLSDPERFRSEMEAAGFGDVTITPVTKTWTPGSPERYWETFLPASPVFRLMMAGRMDRLDDVRDVFVRTTRERYGDDVRLDCEALIALARK